MIAPLLAAVDDSTGAAAIRERAAGAAVVLFPVSGDWLQLSRLTSELERLGVEVTRADAARLIDQQVTSLRDALPAWTDALADMRAGDGTVAGCLGKGFETSVYWLGSLVERNPLKTPELLTAAVARAFDAELRGRTYAGAIVLLRPGLLADALRGIAGEPAGSRAAGSRWAHAGRGLAAIARQSIWSILARGLRLPRSARTADVLCISYFPYVDRAAAAEGRFVNRYAAPLQELFEKRGVSVAWLGLFVFIDGWSFRDAVALARRFRGSGTDIGLLDAYVSPRLLARVLADFWRVSRQAARIERQLGPALGRGLVPAGADVVAKALWRRAFNGLDLVRSLIYFRVFERVVAETPTPGRTLYFAEFQTWEQGFNASARRAGWQTIAFQHTVVSRNHYFYARSAREVQPGQMPLPSVVAAGGELPAETFRARGLRTIVVESVRQLHVRGALDHPDRAARDPGLLIVGSIDRREMRAMLTLAAAAFPADARQPLRIKAHPSMPAEPLISELGIDPARFEVVGGTVAEWLRRATSVLVGSSAVAVEALAFGCDVIVPAFASAPRLTPLAGWEQFYRQVYSPEDLAATVGGPAPAPEEARRFVERYWALDPALPRWIRLLEATSAGASRATIDIPPDNPEKEGQQVHV